jgi:hypothetical protein
MMMHTKIADELENLIKKKEKESLHKEICYSLKSLEIKERDMSLKKKETELFEMENRLHTRAKELKELEKQMFYKKSNLIMVEPEELYDTTKCNEIRLGGDIESELNFLPLHKSCLENDLDSIKNLIRDNSFVIYKRNMRDQNALEFLIYSICNEPTSHFYYKKFENDVDQYDVLHREFVNLLDVLTNGGKLFDDIVTDDIIQMFKSRIPICCSIEKKVCKLVDEFVFVSIFGYCKKIGITFF